MLEIACKPYFEVTDMTTTNNKNGVLNAPEATNQNGANKTHNSTTHATKHWKLIWQTYACEEQDGHAVPLETKETFFSLKPSGSQIDQLRKRAHALGYKLVAIKEYCPFPNDEF